MISTQAIETKLHASPFHILPQLKIDARGSTQAPHTPFSTPQLLKMDARSPLQSLCTSCSIPVLTQDWRTKSRPSCLHRASTLPTKPASICRTSISTPNNSMWRVIRPFTSARESGESSISGKVGNLWHKRRKLSMDSERRNVSNQSPTSVLGFP